MSRHLESEEDRKIMFGLCIKRKLLKQLDEKRGQVPRSPFISKIIEEYLAKP